MSTLQISVIPLVGPLWQRRHIEINGAVPGSVVTVRAQTDRNGQEWTAQASFLADAQGRIDLSTQAPVSGDYRSADAMGLFWVQCLASGGTEKFEPADVHVPIKTELIAWEEAGTGYLDVAGPVADKQEHRVTVEQWLLAEDTERIEVRSHGLVGTLFRPAGEGPFPTVIVMNGSGGGINETRAAQYASRGLQAFALGYFRAPGLSNYISRTPIEYFERALDYVTAELSPRGGQTGGQRAVSGWRADTATGQPVPRQNCRGSGVRARCVCFWSPGRRRSSRGLEWTHLDVERRAAAPFLGPQCRGDLAAMGYRCAAVAPCQRVHRRPA